MKANKFRIERVEVSALDSRTRDMMWEVFQEYFDSVEKSVFLDDLSRKQHVLLLRRANDHVVRGFTTLTTLEVFVEGKRVIGIFGGDTIVAKEYWGAGSRAGMHEFLKYVAFCKLRNPLTPVYFLLLSKGYRTYRLLARQFVSFWPRFDAPTPAFEAKVLDALSRKVAGGAWIPEEGVVRHAQCLGRLKDGVGTIRADHLADPHVRFFVEKNPGHVDGVDLCCIARIEIVEGARMLLGALLKPAKKSGQSPLPVSRLT